MASRSTSRFRSRSRSSSGDSMATLFRSSAVRSARAWDGEPACLIDPGLLGIAQNLDLVGSRQSKHPIGGEEPKAVFDEMQRRAGLARSRASARTAAQPFQVTADEWKSHVAATEDPLRVGGIDEIDDLVEVGEENSLRVRGARLQAHEHTRRSLQDEAPRGESDKIGAYIHRHITMLVGVR